MPITVGSGTGVELGGCQGDHCPPKFCLPA